MVGQRAKVRAPVIKKTVGSLPFLTETRLTSNDGFAGALACASTTIYALVRVNRIGGSLVDCLDRTRTFAKTASNTLICNLVRHDHLLVG